MNWCLIFLSMLLTSNVFSQHETDSIQFNVTDSLGQKQGHWVIYGEMHPETGYPPKGKIEEGTFVNNRKEGEWIKYYEDGVTPKLKGEFHLSRPWGSYEKYYTSGQLKEKSCFTKGRYSCDLYRWYENGCLKYVKIYDTIAELEITYIYDENNCNVPLDSVRTPYHPDNTNGKVTSIVACNFGSITPQTSRTVSFVQEFPEYSDSALCSCNPSGERQKCYNPANNILFQGTCSDGRLNEGRLYFYDSDGILLRVEVWKDGVFCRLGEL